MKSILRMRPGNAYSVTAMAFYWIAALLLAAIPLVARADDDLPGRVGRVAEVAGQLYLSPEERATEWAAIGLNYPVTSGDNLWVEGEGRAEIDYGGGQFRLAGGTNMHVSRLDDEQLVLFVAQGRLIVNVRALDAGESVQIDTPMTQVQLMRPGLYRVDVAPDTQAVSLVVREGEATLWLAGMAQQAVPGQTIMVRNPAVAEFRNGVSVDGFDTWSADRDRYYGRKRSTAYISPQMVGGSDLDNYGQWATDPEYGPVWYPAGVAGDWAPYSDGYWTNVSAWGPVWVDASRWGYAPFHYGRWARVRGRWGWCPGTYVARPFWAPALVAWYGGPAWGYSARLGAPAYGWVALGWREPYVPAWRNCSNRCWTGYNQPYAVNMQERPRTQPSTRYANAAVPDAVTAVPGAALIGTKPVAMDRLRVPAEAVAGAPVLAAAPPMKPATAGGSRSYPASGLPAPASSVRMATKPAMAGPLPRAMPAPAPGTVPLPSSSRTAGVASNPPGPPPPTRIAAPIVPAPDAGGRIVSAPPGRAPVPVASAPESGRMVGALPPRSDPGPALSRNTVTLAPASVPPQAHDGGNPVAAPQPPMQPAPVYRGGGNAVAVPQPQPPMPSAAAYRADRSVQGPALPPPRNVAPAPVPEASGVVGYPHPVSPPPLPPGVPQAVPYQGGAAGVAPHGNGQGGGLGGPQGGGQGGWQSSQGGSQSGGQGGWQGPPGQGSGNAPSGPGGGPSR